MLPVIIEKYPLSKIFVIEKINIFVQVRKIWSY